MLNLMSFKELYLILCFINFTLSTLENGFCDKANEYEETDNKCNIQSHYSKNRFEIILLFFSE